MSLEQVQSGVETPAVTQSGVGTPIAAQPGDPRANQRWVTAILVLVALSALVVFSLVYYTRAHKGYLNKSACDIGQIARNVYTSREYATNIIRPFNLGFPQSGQRTFPEINRAPLFPSTVVAAYRFRGISGQAITSASLLFFLALLGATFYLGTLLFDYRGGLLGAAIVGLSKPMLEAAVSGEEWTALALWFTLLLCVVALHHRASSRQRKAACVVYAIVAGVLTGLLYCTHYAMFVLIIPLAVYFGVTGKARLASTVAFLIVACGLMSPLVVRNYSLTASPLLGASAWDVMADTTDYPGDLFYRSIRWQQGEIRSLLMFPVEHFSSFSEKTVRRAADQLGFAIAMLGLLGLPFAAVTSLYRFKNPHTNAVRGFCYGAAATIILPLAALGVAEVYVMVFAPVIAVISAGYLFLLAGSKRLHPVYLRLVLIGLLAITVAPGVAECLWSQAHPRDASVDRLPQLLPFLHTNTPIFTDQPWTVSWSKTNPSVWLPVKDADVDQLAAVGLPMAVVILTQECRKYPDDDIWKAIYTVPLWLDYTTGKATIESLVRTAGVSESLAPQVKQFVTRRRRDFTISSETLGDMVKAQTDPLLPNDVLIIYR